MMSHPVAKRNDQVCIQFYFTSIISKSYIAVLETLEHNTFPMHIATR